MKEKLNGKDLMNIGIFTALNIVIEMVIACTIGLIPLGFILVSSIIPVITGIPMMLYFTRIKKFGMLLITTVINGVMMVLTGMGPDALIYGVISSFLAELIMKSGKYQSSWKAILAFAVYNLSGAANYIHWLGASEEWLAEKAVTYGQAYMETIAGYFEKNWVFPLIILGSFAGGFLGGLLGKTVLKKHFVKSGLV